MHVCQGVQSPDLKKYMCIFLVSTSPHLIRHFPLYKNTHLIKKKNFVIKPHLRHNRNLTELQRSMYLYLPRKSVLNLSAEPHINLILPTRGPVIDMQTS